MRVVGGARRGLLFALAAGLLAACVAPPPAEPTAAESALAIADALQHGHLDEAEVLLQRGRQRHPGDGALLAWGLVVAGLTWQDGLAVAEAAHLLRSQDRGGLALAECRGLLGEALFAAGRFGEAAATLRDGAVGPAAERRAAYAVIARRLPEQRHLSGPLATERPLPAASGLPEFECSVGDVRRPFVIDTGSSMTTVTASLAAELGVRGAMAAGHAADGTGRTMPVSVGVLEPFAVGDVELGATPVLIVDDQRFVLRDQYGGPERPVHGVLGLDLLALFRITLDARRGSVVLELPRGLSTVESERCVRADGRCLLPVAIDGVKLWFVLDTGASHSSLTEAGLALLPGGDERATPTFRRVRTVGGTTLAVREVRDLVLRASAARFRGVDLPVVPRAPGTVFPVHGVLGNDLLLACRVTLDGGRVRLQAVE